MTTIDAGASAELPPIGEYLSESWNLYTERLWLLLTVAGLGAAGCMLSVFLPFLAALVLTVLRPSVMVWVLEALLSLSASLWLASWMQAAMIEAALDPHNKPDWRACYKSSWPKVAPFSWVSILFILMVAGAAFAFMGPGSVLGSPVLFALGLLPAAAAAVFLGVAFCFAPVVVVSEGTPGWGALERSMNLVSGRWGAVALRLFIGGLLAALPAKIPLIGWILGAFSAPFAMVAAVVLFDSLRSLPAPERAPSAFPTKATPALAGAGLLLLGAAGVRAATALREAMPDIIARLQDMAAHPDQEKLQALLAKLESGDTAQSVSGTWQFIQSSSGTAVGNSSGNPGP